MTLLSVYAPTEASDELVKDQFYEILGEHLQNVPVNDKVILLGDLNARVGKNYHLWEKILGRHGIGNCNGNGLRLLSLCAEHDLAITNTMFQLRNIHKTTWQHPRSRHWHMLDYVMVRQRDLHEVKITRAMRGANAATDHRMLRSAMTLKIRPQARKRAAQPRLNLAALQNPDTRAEYQRVLAENLPPVPEPSADISTESLSADWSATCEIILQAAKDTLGTSRKRHRDWFDENATEIMALIKRKNLAHDACLRHDTPANQNTLSEMRSHVQRELRRMENTWWVGMAQEMQSSMDTGDLHRFYSSLKSVYGPTQSTLCPVRTADGETLISDREGILSRWAEHFKDLLNRINPMDPTFLDEIPQLPVLLELDDPPSLEEVNKSISGLKNHKAAGPDTIPAELLKYGGDATLHQLFDFIQTCWQTGHVPQQFKDGKIIFIYKKKGDKAVCGNSRGITLLSHGGKALARVMLSRLINNIAERVLPESQCGFRRERSTVDMIFVARQLQEKCREQHKDLYAAFVDLSKAFDTVNREALWKLLAKFGCPPKMITLISALHDGMTATVVANGGESESFESSVGVRQGCVLAPILFNLFVSAITTLVHQNNNINETGVHVNYRLDGNLFDLSRLKARTRVSTVTVNELQYADDAAWVSHTAIDLQQTLSAVNAAYSRSGLAVNTSKTEVLVQRTDGDQPPTDQDFSIDDQTLKQVPKFTYLGSVLSNDCSINDEVTRRIALASNAFGKLSRRVFLNHNITLATKRAVYRAVCLSILMYGCESWAPYRHQLRKLESYHIRCLQRMLNLHWWDKIPHNEIRARFNIPSLEEILRQRQLRWVGHVIRQPPDRLPRMALYGELREGRRTVGGQKKRFKDHVKASLKKFNMNPSTLEADASDRTRWRSLTNAGAAHFGGEYNAAADVRRERRHNRQGGGVHTCGTCGRGCASLAGLRSHQRTHT